MTIPTFPDLPGLGYPINLGVQFITARYESLSGKRTYAPKTTFPRRRWMLPYSFLRSASWGTPGYQELEDLIGFFNARSADGLVFSYQDQEDNTATNAGFGLGDGETVDFQLYRAFGGYAEPVYGPEPTSMTVLVGGVATVDYTLNDTGIITFGTAPADGDTLVWSGTFSYLCRFDDDTQNLERFLQGASRGSIRFSSETVF